MVGNSMELELEECTSESVIQFYRGKKWWIQSMIKRSRYKRYICSRFNSASKSYLNSGSGFGSWCCSKCISNSWAK